MIAFVTGDAIDDLGENGVAVSMSARRDALGLLEDIFDDQFFHQTFRDAHQAVWIVEHI